jgi:DNA-binding LytR/AlgR family response regulator
MARILLIEDELPAAKRLSKLIMETAPDFEIVQICDSIESSIHYLKTQVQPELIFLDVQLGDGLSFEIFKDVDITCPVIFTTAYDEYVFRAFELNSIDYLMKPIHQEALAKSIEKFRKLSQASLPDWKFLTTLVDPEKNSYKQRFLVNVGSNLLSVPTNDVAYFYSVERSTFLVTQSGKTYSLDYSLDKMEGMLSPKVFFRVNRQFLVSLSAIKKILVLSKSRMKVALEPASTEDVFVSNGRAHEFRLWLDR